MILTIVYTLLHLESDRHRNYRLNSIEKPKETEVPSQCPGETFFSTLLHCVRFFNFLYFLYSSAIKLLFRKNEVLVETFIFTSSTHLSINIMKKRYKVGMKFRKSGCVHWCGSAGGNATDWSLHQVIDNHDFLG